MLQQIKQLPLREEDTVFIEAIEQQAQEKQMKLGVFGSFSVGKSALINALIGNTQLLPTHTNETTAVPTYILGADEDRIDVYKFNGEMKTINSLQLHALKAGAEVNEIEKINVYRTAPSWLKDITLIDTPGRNTKFQAHIDASEQALVTSDAVLYVMPWQGLTLEDIVYIKHILRYQPNLYFVINKVDRIDEAQGITVEQLQQRVATDLQEQLGKSYPVYAVSATTGLNIDVLYTQFLVPLKEQIQQLKQSRFEHAFQQFLQHEKERITQQIQLFEQAAAEDNNDFEAQKQALQIKYEQVNIDVANNVEQVRATLFTAEQELKAYIQKSYSDLEVQLKNLLKLNLSVEQLTLKAEDIVVTKRNEVFEVLCGRIQKIVGEEVSLEIQQLQGNCVDIQISQPNFALLQEQYESERMKVMAKLENAQQQLVDLPEGEASDIQRERLLKEIEVLTERAVEQFVPQYIVDESFDASKATKIASTIGFVGDMALAAGLAIATSGGSAAAQVGGKVAAKETAKQLTKKATSEVAKEAAKQARKKVVQELAEKTLIAGVQAASNKSDNKVLKAAQALDKFTSPVQTIAKKIGESIDSTRSQPVQEDMQYRRDFFARKYELESERDAKLIQLQELEQRAQMNEKMKQEVAQKRSQVEQASQQKLEQLEKNYEQQLQQAHEKHINDEIAMQLQLILSAEEQQLNDWFKTEFATILNTVEKMLPQQLQQQLQSWEDQIQHVEHLKAQGASKITEQLSTLQQNLKVINAAIKGEANAISL